MEIKKMKHVFITDKKRFYKKQFKFDHFMLQKIRKAGSL